MKETLAAEQGERIPVRVVRNAKPKQVQQRLTAEVVAELVAAYQAGATVPELAGRFQVHRTTVSAHLERRGIPRRGDKRNLTEKDVVEGGGPLAVRKVVQVVLGGGVPVGSEVLTP